LRDGDDSDIVPRDAMLSPIRTERLRLLAAFVLSVRPAVAAANQTPPATLSAALRPHVKDERFQTVTSVRGLPLGVRDALQTLFASPTLDIADPGLPFQVTDVIIEPKLPIRRLVAAGCSTDHRLVYYERDGVAHTWHLVLFHWVPDATRAEVGGMAPNSLVTIEDLRTTILSGAIKRANE
jgi:hypothetical protein